MIRRISWRVGSFSLLAASLVVVLASCGSSGRANPSLSPDQSSAVNQQASTSGSGRTDLTALHLTVPPFRYTDEQGKPFDSTQLKGKVWLADMIFTHCTTVCPPMTAHMAKLQQQLAQQGLKVPIVSFSVDPKRDDPAALRTFAENYHADTSTWHFLTGYSPQEIQQFAYQAFRAPVQAEPMTDQFIHSSSFYVIGPDGRVRYMYDGVQTPYGAILADVKALESAGK
ncbi:MAG: SCO family protein [Firmicutes bacterium]|nr:SCO family protein [Bacillota bacterium]